MASNARPSGNPSRTKVARRPYWVSFDNEGKGGWRFLAADAAHNQQMISTDPETGGAIYVEGVYESKGYEPIHRVPANDPRRKSLPTNWQAMCSDHKTIPIFDKVKADAA